MRASERGGAEDDRGRPAEDWAARSLGERIKAARLARRKTLAEVAADSGLTKGFVSKLERDQADASVASLMRLCDALGISVGTLFNASQGEVVRHHAYPRLTFGGTGIAEFVFFLTPAGEQGLYGDPFRH